MSLSVPSDIGAPVSNEFAMLVTLTNAQSIATGDIDATITFNGSIIDASGATLTGGVLDGENYSIEVNATVDGEVSLALKKLVNYRTYQKDRN